MSKKILWASLYSLHDTSSGAAISSRTQLEELVKQGFTVKVLTAFVFDNPRGTSMFPDLDEKLNSERRIFTVSADGIEYVYVKTASRYVNEVTVAEENFFLQVYFDMLRRFQPDIMMGYGGEPLSFIMRREAKARGISVVYNLCNGSHQNFRFPDVDLIITKSRATVDYYARWGNAVRNTGVFIRPESVRALKREPKYITFINPTPEKGTALFARLAMMSKKELPDEKFLVVQSRGHFQTTLRQIQNFATHTHTSPESKDTSLTLSTDSSALDGALASTSASALPDNFVTSFTNVDVAEHTNQISAVYALTKVLIVPSLWHESIPRVALEAEINGIPVLGSNNGGIPEAIAGGGLVCTIPQQCMKNYLYLPSEEEMRPWMDALKRLLSEDWSGACRRSAERNALDKSTARLVALLNPLVDKAHKSKSIAKSWYLKKVQ